MVVVAERLNFKSDRLSEDRGTKVWLITFTDLVALMLAFFDRITAAIGSPPPGLKFDMEFVIGTAYGKDGNLAVKETLEMARAGAFAREMTSRGTSPDSISIGLAPQGSEQVILRFYVRTRDNAGVQEP